MNVPIAISEDTDAVLRSGSREGHVDDFLRQLVTSSRAKFLLNEPVDVSVVICGKEHDFAAIPSDGDPGEGRVITVLYGGVRPCR